MFDYHEDLECMYWSVLTKTWQEGKIKARVIEGYYDYVLQDCPASYTYRKLLSFDDTVCTKEDFPVVDINDVVICVYYLEGQEKEAIDALNDAIHHKVNALQDETDCYILASKSLMLFGDNND